MLKNEQYVIQTLVITSYSIHYTKLYDYEVIEECLRRALQHLYQQRKREQLQQYGQLLETNETELMNHVVTQLFSRIPEDVDSSLEFLNKMGYPIRITSYNVCYTKLLRLSVAACAL